MAKKITIEELYDMAKEYSSFSCSPAPELKKYKTGHIFDEDRSVKWNREEVIRRNTLFDETVKQLNREKNAKYNALVARTKKYIMQETGVSETRAAKVYDYAYRMWHSGSLLTVLCELDELIEIFKD